MSENTENQSSNIKNRIKMFETTCTTINNSERSKPKLAPKPNRTNKPIIQPKPKIFNKIQNINQTFTQKDNTNSARPLHFNNSLKLERSADNRPVPPPRRPESFKERRSNNNYNNNNTDKPESELFCTNSNRGHTKESVITDDETLQKMETSENVLSTMTPNQLKDTIENRKEDDKKDETKMQLEDSKNSVNILLNQQNETIMNLQLEENDDDDDDYQKLKNKSEEEEEDDDDWARNSYPTNSNTGSVNQCNQSNDYKVLNMSVTADLPPTPQRQQFDTKRESFYNETFDEENERNVEDWQKEIPKFKHPLPPIPPPPSVTTEHQLQHHNSPGRHPTTPLPPPPPRSTSSFVKTNNTKHTIDCFVENRCNSKDDDEYISINFPEPYRKGQSEGNDPYVAIDRRISESDGDPYQCPDTPPPRPPPVVRSPKKFESSSAIHRNLMKENSQKNAVDNNKVSDDFTNKNWYFDISKEQSSILMKDFGKTGTYLVRPSDGKEYVMMIRISNDEIKKFKIRSYKDGWILGDVDETKIIHDSMSCLMTYYETNGIKTGENHIHLKETIPKKYI